ncbi:hypothetical protein HS088_TW08G00080 [Tripterygium wilfordii]|uniref:Tic22-like family protein n=1 Tax=Tripterygium wilfordii TaxID=458696 RepID=A0A7J7DBR1_TRIWF|nr:uncharacterized protein LOC120003286 [Tripterygium wilfordii]KAF5743496.1 hypothetical protein HS088_TW08G00080 [Tripterygium wilfordii]
MASPQKRPQNHHNNHFQFVHSTATAFLSPPKMAQSPPSKVCVPLLFRNSSSESSQPDSLSSSNPASVKGVSSGDSGSGFPSTVRIAGLNANGKGGGPAFVGQVFSMCDLSGTGLMAVSTHFDIPFISKRTPEWLKKMFATVTKSERNGPVFRFFMDLGDAVTYVKKLNIPSGVVGACRLDLAYEHFKEKPHLFQFVPNERQVKAANKILKTNTQNGGNRRVDGVPVFSAQNLDIAIATTDGIKWYTPYFFDKNMLDNILEDSVDQHFNALIQTRHVQRRRDVIDDNMAADVLEEIGDSLLEPPEIQEVMDEMGHSGLPLSVISKAAEIQLLYAVDKVLLGNRWLRKATGIQPKFPYMVDSFEKRSAFSIQRASESTSSPANSEREDGSSELALEDNVGVDLQKGPDFRFPFGDWARHPWLKQQLKPQKGSDTRAERLSRGSINHTEYSSPLLPKITMVGISTGEVGQMSKASLKKTMEDLTRELEQTEQGSSSDESSGNEYKIEDRDPLFVANVGDYYSRMGRMAKAGSARWVGQGND